MHFAKNLRVASWRHSWVPLGCLTSLLLGGLTACSTVTSETTTSTSSSGSGTLEIVANGEDFIRQGFLTKDQWQLDFDHVYVTLSDITVAPPDRLQVKDAPQVDKRAALAASALVVSDAVTVDLAAGGEQAEPIEVTSLEAPAGHYKALSWHLVPAQQGESAGSSLVLEGQAQKGAESIQFSLRLDPKMSFTCGDFIGETRKGILAEDQSAELEATFHFDHLFGDGDASSDEEINVKALGFEPIAKLASNGAIDLDKATLMSKLSSADAQKLDDLLLSLGHVGEGHCQAARL